MFFKQYELGCLSLFSYLIGDTTTGRAIVVDPQRDVSGYLSLASERDLNIELVIETHIHADFLSGHLELAQATGAAIAFGRGAQIDFPIRELRHGERIELGEVVVEVRATPGHTPESISLVVWEHGDDIEPWAVLTGDALFLGDVGRPDLLASAGKSPGEMGRMLYNSIHTQLLTLPDATKVFPAHGAGSACGKQLSTAMESTIGEQRATNYALVPMSEDEFVAVVTEGQSAAPPYFGHAVQANRRARDLLDDQAPPRLLGIEEALEAVRSGAVVLDTRIPEIFASGHIAGSINVGLDGRFAEYAGDVVSPNQDIILVADEGRETEAKVRLARIGFDKVMGHLKEVERILVERPELAERSSRITAADFAKWRDDQSLQVVDVRNLGELELGLVPGARSAPLAVLISSIEQGALDPAAPTVVYCAGGYRSSIAASTMRNRGFKQVAELQGGFPAWVGAEFPVAELSTNGVSESI